jgi:hypothetical protein
MMPSKGNKSKKLQSDRYKAEGRLMKNKVTKLTRVLKDNPNDRNAQQALEAAQKALGIKK